MEIIVNLKCKHINNVKDLPNEVWKDIPDYECPLCVVNNVETHLNL